MSNKKEALESLGIVSGSIYPEFAEGVAAEIGVEPIAVKRKMHANGEIYVKYEESVRDKDLFIFQAHAGGEVDGRQWSLNDAVLEHLLLGGAAMRSNERRWVGIMPYLAYSRQERKTKSGEPIAAADLVAMLGNIGYKRLVSVELHAGQIQGFFKGPFDNLTAGPTLRKEVLKPWIEEHGKGNVVLVAPDAGRTKAVAHAAEEVDIPYATVDKRRDPETSMAVATDIIGRVRGLHAMMFDDMFDSCGTLKTGAELVMDRDALSINAMGVHGVLTSKAAANIAASPLGQVFVTNSLPQKRNEAEIPNLRVIDMTPMVAKAIWRIHRHKSLRKLFHDEHLS